MGFIVPLNLLFMVRYMYIFSIQFIFKKNIVFEIWVLPWLFIFVFFIEGTQNLCFSYMVLKVICFYFEKGNLVHVDIDHITLVSFVGF